MFLECVWSHTNFYKSYFFNVQFSKHYRNCNMFSYSNEQNVANDFLSCVLSWLESDQLIVVLFTHTCPSLPPPPVRYGRLLKLSGLGSCRCLIYNLIIPAQLTDIWPRYHVQMQQIHKVNIVVIINGLSQLFDRETFQSKSETKSALWIFL